MTRHTLPKLLPLALAACAATAAQAGVLETLPKGHYQCSLPGDAASEPWHPVEGAAFTIINASSYKSDNGERGTYLLTGKQLVFTKGPLINARFERTGDTLLRKLDDDGKPSRVLCARSAR